MNYVIRGEVVYELLSSIPRLGAVTVYRQRQDGLDKLYAQTNQRSGVP
jgi:hypothetical protein